MITGKVHVEKLVNLKKLLKDLPKELEYKVLNKAIRTVTVDMSKAVREAAPVGKSAYLYGNNKYSNRVQHSPGTLKKAISVAKLTKSKFIKFAVIAKHHTRQARRKVKQYSAQDAFYWYWVEFGHLIVPRGGGHETSARKSSVGIKKRRFMDSNEVASKLEQGAGIGRQGKKYSFVPPNPFIRRTFRDKGPAIAKKIEDAIVKWVNKVNASGRS